MDMTFVGWDGFSRVVATFVFDSWCMYSFSGALTSVAPSFSVCFWLLFASSWYFILSYVLLLFFLDIKPSG